MIRAGCCLHLSVLLMALAVGCQLPPFDPDEESDIDAALAEALRRQPIDEAIIVQHTLYPYHFAVNSASLNELGQRDLGVLAQHLKSGSGPLNVRQGQESDDIFRARIDSVLQMLLAAGVARSRIEVSNGLPGGEGMYSEWVLKVLAQDAQMGSYGAGAGGSGGAISP